MICSEPLVLTRVAEVAGAQRRVRHAEEREQALLALVAFERSEEEHLVLGDRPAERAAVGVRLRPAACRAPAPTPKKYGFAFSLSLLKHSNADPLNWFVPDLVMTVTAAPPAMPCSASKLLVEMLTVSIVSAGDTYMLWFGSQMFMFVAPSVRVELFVFACPLTLVAIDRAGVSVSALPNAIGVVPGTRFISAW